MSTNKSSNCDGIKKIIQDTKFAGKLILKDMLPIKMSTVLLDFVKHRSTCLESYFILTVRCGQRESQDR